MSFQNLVIFDLDETIIDSSHRTPNHPDGTLDLARYFAMKNRESIFQDTLLPLAQVFKSLNRDKNYIVICTARAMNQDDRDYLAQHEIHAHLILCRPENGSENHIKDPVLKARKIQRLRNLKQFQGKAVIMFDDSKPVIRKMREIGVICMNAIKVNKRLKNPL